MNRVKLLRNERKINQLKLACDVHTTQSSISKYEQGKAVPDTNILINLTNYFGVSTDYLLGLSPLRTMDASLSQQESAFLQEYNSLTQKQKAQVLAFMQGLNA